MFDGVFIQNLLASFPLPLFEDSCNNDTQPIMVNLSLLQFDMPPLIDVPSIKTSSTLLLGLMYTPYDAHMTDLPSSKMQNHY